MKKIILLFSLVLGLGLSCFAAAGDEWTDPDVNTAMEQYGANKISQDLVNYCDAQKSTDFYEKLLKRLAFLIKEDEIKINQQEGITGLSFSKSHISKFNDFLVNKRPFGIDDAPKDTRFIRALKAAKKELGDHAQVQDIQRFDELLEDQEQREANFLALVLQLQEQREGQKQRERQEQQNHDLALAFELQEQEGRAHQEQRGREERERRELEERQETKSSSSVDLLLQDRSDEEDDQLNEDQSSTEDINRLILEVVDLNERLARRAFDSRGTLGGDEAGFKNKIALRKKELMKLLEKKGITKDLSQNVEYVRRLQNQREYEASLMHGFLWLEDNFVDGQDFIKNNNDLISKMNQLGECYFEKNIRPPSSSRKLKKKIFIDLRY